MFAIDAHRTGTTVVIELCWSTDGPDKLQFCNLRQKITDILLICARPPLSSSMPLASCMTMKSRTTSDGIAPRNQPATTQVGEKRGRVGNFKRKHFGIPVSDYIGEMYVA